MAEEPRPYTRLTRNSAGLASYASLWLGADHLLLVKSTGFMETYARVHLRDIQAIFVLASDRRTWWALGWGVPALIFAIVAGGTLAKRGELPFISGPLFLLLLGAFVWNLLLGPGCQVFLLTGVQTARLPSLVRQKQARRVLAKLQPLIAAAQTDFVPPPPAGPGLETPPA
ncbi:MAG: hypothetical protein JNK23_17745 [Opitutaceae bacterium]|nr:hypothetical protein [Opitutaceae bacterium]